MLYLKLPPGMLKTNFLFFLGIPIRGFIGIQIFFAVFMVYMLRVSISINLLAMIETNDKIGNNTIHLSDCVTEGINSSSFDEDDLKPLNDVSMFF